MFNYDKENHIITLSAGEPVDILFDVDYKEHDVTHFYLLREKFCVCKLENRDGSLIQIKGVDTKNLDLFDINDDTCYYYRVTLETNGSTIEKEYGQIILLNN